MVGKVPADRNVREKTLQDLRVGNVHRVRIVAGIEDLVAEAILFQAEIDDLTKIPGIDIAEDVSAPLRRIFEEVREAVIFMWLDDVADPKCIDVGTGAPLRIDSS